MTLTPLPRRTVDKPWGRTGIDARYGADPARKVGEIWFEAPEGRSLKLMAKYLFTSERLSVQVHPDDATAKARGHASGKEEGWIVLEADADAEIGIGTREAYDRDAVLEAAKDGSIVEMIDWKTPKAGDFIFNSAGTIHALGPGLVIIEVQPAVDLTYRLYDYGRDRPLHLAEAADVIVPKPHADPHDRAIAMGESQILVDDAKFGIAWCKGNVPASLAAKDEMQILPVDAPITVEGVTLKPGECGLYDGDPQALTSDGAFILAWA